MSIYLTSHSVNLYNIHKNNLTCRSPISILSMPANNRRVGLMTIIKRASVL